MDNSHNLGTASAVEADEEWENTELTVPAKMPAAPTPEIALPTIKAAELGAAPQRAEATSNIRTLARRTILTE